MDWLEKNKYGTGVKKGTKILFCAPYRQDRNPSMCVSTNPNLWYDYATQEGGNLINLVQKINPGWSNHQVLAYLEKQIEELGLVYAEDYEGQKKLEEDQHAWAKEQQEERDRNTVIKNVCMLVHPYLRNYILDRRIDFEVARQYCKEVHYTYDHKSYYAIGFENIEGGMEARNKYTKRCIGKKTISFIQPYTVPQKHCCIFEGFFDMLTYATMLRWMRMGVTVEEPCDYFVMNSTACLKILLPYLKDYQVIHCYLDTDSSGKNTTEAIVKAYPGKAIDESYRYEGYNDLNDLLCGKPKATDK